MGKGGKKERRRRQAVEEAEQQQQNSGTKEVVKRSKAEKVQAKRKKVDASADVAPAPGKRSRDLQLAAGKDSPRRKRTKVDKDPCSDSKDSSNKTVLTSLETDQHNECPSETSDCGQNENAPEEVAVVTPREVRRVGRRSSAGTSSAKTAAAAADLIKSPMAMAKYVAEQVGSDSEVNGDEPVQHAKFVGSPFSKAKAKARWPHRYETKDKVLNDASNRLNREAAADDREDVDCVAHYSKALVDGMLFELDDTVEINNEGGKNFIGKVVEMFEKRDGSPWITAQWFFYVEDTALGEDGKDSGRHDPKRLFFSDVQDANPLDCLVKKVSVTRVPTVQLDKDISLEQSDFVYDMGYTTAYSAFYSLPADGSGTPSSQKSSEVPCSEASESSQDKERSESSELSLLDLYAGCGAMSTGLCSGARLAGHNLISRWAVDINQEACESYKYNHPETEVRNEKADDFFALIKEWQQLCAKYPLGSTAESKPQEPKADDNEDSDDDSEELSDEVFEVQKLLAVKYEEPQGLLFKVRWKGYSEDEDTWEPLANLEDCPERLEEFVVEGRRNNLLPLPGKVDVICGGPPCQGASGFNRFRNYTNPLADPRNHQMVVYMDIVDFLKPRFILMENVVDILKFCGGVLGKYALSRLVSMHYQAKIGLLVAGSYGLPQFRMRVFLWGASTTEKLPAFPLPTHDVVKRGHPPVHWEQNLVSLDEDEKHRLEKALVLQDAISDLPPISNYEKRDERAYGKPPQTPFQRLVRMQKPDAGKPVLYDHKSLIMNKDDYDRACQIPKRKGANFRDLEGVIVYDDKTVAVEQKNRKMLASGKPLVPDYAITFVGGKSCKPFGRLWWDETVSTVVTRAEPHNQAVLHPSQDRVLSIRENARLQGFPDHYKLFGDTKEKYKQVGNAVAVPVARALGYALGKAISDDVSGADFLLPQGFPMSLIDAEGPPSYSLDLPQTVTGADFQLPESMFASKELTLPQDVPGADFQLPESMFSAKDSDSS